MLDWVIDVLNSYRAKGSAGELELALTVAIPLISAILAIAFAAGKYAQWRYRKDIAVADELRQQLAARSETVKDRDKEIGQLKNRIEILESQTAAGFLKKMNREAQDENFEKEVAHSEQYLADNQEALHRAFTTLMKEAIAHAPEDGAPSFENARLFALAGIVVNPDDGKLREIAEELRQAAGAAADGAKVFLKPDIARKERRAQREALPNNLEALKQCWDDAYERGQYQLCLAFAEHGHLMASRGEGQFAFAALYWSSLYAYSEQLSGSPQSALHRCKVMLPHLESKTNIGLEHSLTLNTRYLIALCLKETGNPAEGLKLAQKLLPDYERVCGNDNPYTLRTRHLTAYCLKDTGNPAEGLKLAQELLPDYERVCGKDHPHTHATRYLIAYCMKDTGKAADALKLAQELLPSYERVCGKDHPHTLHTRGIIAYCLQDTGNPVGALKLARELLPHLERVSGKDHPSTHATRYLIACCMKDTGKAADALKLAQELLPDDERVRGKDHPSTLKTRSLMADLYLDADQAGLAASTHDGVLEKLFDHGLIETHRDVMRAKEVDIRLSKSMSNKEDQGNQLETR